VERLWTWLRRDWWALVVLFVSFMGTINIKRHEHGYAEPTIIAGLLVVAAVLPLFWRTRRPDLVVLANAAAVAVYFGSTYGDGPVYLSVLLSTFALTLRRPPRVWLPYAGAALATIVTGLIVRQLRVGDNTTLESIGWITWFVTVNSAAAALGLAVRNRRETHDEQVRRTATEERLRMAQDLHDGVGHGLSVIAMQAGVALHVLDQDPAAARRSLEAIRDTSRESLAALRDELVRLSPAEGESAPRKPRNGLADLEVLAARIRAGGVQVVLDVESSPVDLVETPADEVAYVVVQEALTNVLRHSAASTARVRVRRTGTRLEIEVIDDGRGDVTPTGDGEGLGIPGMRSRVEALGGRLEAGPRPEGGFEVTALIPINTAPTEGTNA
jgi:signal transduction histidine kinase